MKKCSTILLALAAAAALTACQSGKPAETTAAAPETTQETQAETSTEESAAKETAAETTAAETAAEETAAEETSAEESSAEESSADKDEAGDVIIHIGSLKGPTTMGLVSLMDAAAQGNTADQYEFTMAAAADELTAGIASGSLDIALVPANVASVLYNKTNGGVSVIDINTLGVLYVVASDDSIQSIPDLKGRTILMTGKGATPDYVFHYLLSENGLSDDDLTLEFKSEATEVAAALKEQSNAVAVLPQPFVTAACAQNENLKIVLDLTKEWDDVQKEGGSRLVTGVTIVRNEFLDSHKDLVENFMAAHEASAEFANTNIDETAELVAAQGIIEKAPVAKKALPYCNITCISGEEMKQALSGYLQVLADQDPKSVGGAVPADDFYYIIQ